MARKPKSPKKAQARHDLRVAATKQELLGSGAQFAPDRRSHVELHQVESPSCGLGQQWEIYRDERKSLHAAEEAYAERFDKWIVALAGGGLALSMTFVKDLISPRAPVALRCLFVAWASFGVCLIVSLGCALLCQRAREKFGDDLDAAFNMQTPNPLLEAASRQSSRREPVWIARLNRLNVLSFGVAVTAMAYFIYKNLLV